MTEKIKAKNADAICALVNGETVQGKGPMTCFTGETAISELSWNDVKIEFEGYYGSGLAARVAILYGGTRHELKDLGKFLDNYMLRLKHPHQDMIDQIEADPSLEEYLECCYSRGFTITHGVSSAIKDSYAKSSLEKLRKDMDMQSKFRINKPAHPHQKLIDLHKANPEYQLQVYDEIMCAWIPVGKLSPVVTNRNYRLIKAEIIAESKGVKDE